METQKLLDDLNRESLTLSTIGRRSTALLIDKIIVSVIFSFILLDGLDGSLGVEELIIYINSMIIYYVLLEIIYHTFFIWYSGATPGKTILKIRVIDTEYFEKPTLINALSRSVVRILGDFLFYINYIFAYFNPAIQTLQDKVGKTVAVDA